MKAKFSENFTFIFLLIQKGNRIVKEVTFFLSDSIWLKEQRSYSLFLSLLVKAFAIFSIYNSFFSLWKSQLSFIHLFGQPGFSYCWFVLAFETLNIFLLASFYFYLHPSLNDIYCFSSKCIQIIIHSWLFLKIYSLYHFVIFVNNIKKKNITY